MRRNHFYFELFLHKGGKFNKVNINDIKSNQNFTFIKGDLVKEELLTNLKGDILVHLASQKIPRYENSLRTLEDNNLMTKKVIEKCLLEKIKLVFASTSDVYGKNPEIPFSENHDLVLGPTKIKRWAYAASKIYSEHTIIANSEANNLKFTIVRFFGSFGENQNLSWWGGPQSVFIEKAIKGETIEIHGDGKQTRTFTYIKDTIDGLKRCCIDKKAENEIFNIAGNPNQEIQIIELAKLIWKLVNPTQNPKLKFIPYKTFGNYEDVKRRVPCINKIKSQLGFNPSYSLEEGLKSTINWQKRIQNLL